MSQKNRNYALLIFTFILLLLFLMSTFVGAETQEELKLKKQQPQKQQPQKQQPQKQQPQKQQPQKQQPQKQQPQKQQPQQKQQGLPGQSGKPGMGQPGTTNRQGIHETVHQPGKTHLVERTELNRKLKAPVTREAQERAVNHYREERARFVRHAPPMRFLPGHRVILTRMRIVPGTYHYRRNVFYETYGYVPYPFIYTMYPRYGLWDTVFLGFMVERAEEREYALMYYNHRNEEEIIQWRQDMDRMAMDNAELRAKLDVMDQQVANLQGTPVDSAYVPEGAQDIALSPDVIDKLTQAPPTAGQP
jgi:hypothetical protein